MNYYKFSELFEIKNGKDYRNLKTGLIPVFASGGIISHVDSYLYDQPTVILNFRGSIQNIFYVDFPFFCVRERRNFFFGKFG